MPLIVSGKRVVRALRRLGFEVVSQRGSHKKLRRDGRVVIVPMHTSIAPGTLRSVLRQAGLSEDELRTALS